MKRKELEKLQPGTLVAIKTNYGHCTPGLVVDTRPGWERAPGWRGAMFRRREHVTRSQKVAVAYRTGGDGWWRPDVVALSKVEGEWEDYLARRRAEAAEHEAQKAKAKALYDSAYDAREELLPKLHGIDVPDYRVHIDRGGWVTVKLSAPQAKQLADLLEEVQGS